MNPQENNEQKAVLADRVFDGRAWHADAAVLIDGRTVRGIAAQGEVPPDYRQIRLPTGSFVAPGFIDLQVNGGGGVLLNDDPSAEAMRAIVRAHRRFGTTALLPTLITDTCKKIDTAISAAHAVAGKDGVLGLHLEGPFINPARAGVHSRDRIARAEMDDLEWLRELGQAGRSLITLAPECVPAGFIRALVECGIRVSAGHSEASAEIVMRALDEGMTGVTHLFNAMPPFQGRAPGLVGAALADNRLVAGIIVDGIHVDPVSVRAAFAAKGADGIALVTDAMPTVGANTETFQLMNRTISLRNGQLATAEGTLAGAHLDLASAVRNTVKLCGIPLDDALRAASSTPARFLGLEHERGTLTAGARADLVALTNDFNVVACWMGGIEESEFRSP
ncbi:MAG TPA: N-acetylglucosamine-6-phosphate deacetylase [Rhizomicrobium sp.]|jgi:N-acetylglucosamine-6-phosphate deacetylase|nr:N-acetylglucosamine-6-phosphate deacetylase [Rhizomicrobium sp.]